MEFDCYSSSINYVWNSSSFEGMFCVCVCTHGCACPLFAMSLGDDQY